MFDLNEKSASLGLKKHLPYILHMEISLKG